MRAGQHIQPKHDARLDYQALIHVAFRARGKTSILIDATVEQAISTCSAKNKRNSAAGFKQDLES
jgi:hypothetical protein